MQPKVSKQIYVNPLLVPQYKLYFFWYTFYKHTNDGLARNRVDLQAKIFQSTFTFTTETMLKWQIYRRIITLGLNDNTLH